MEDIKYLFQETEHVQNNDLDKRTNILKKILTIIANMTHGIPLGHQLIDYYDPIFLPIRNEIYILSFGEQINLCMHSYNYFHVYCCFNLMNSNVKLSLLTNHKIKSIGSMVGSRFPIYCDLTDISLNIIVDYLQHTKRKYIDFRGVRKQNRAELFNKIKNFIPINNKHIYITEELKPLLVELIEK
jgi:hypothetical protein